MTTLVCVTAMVAVEVKDGITVDEDTIMLAADTAERNNNAQSENISAKVLWRDRRAVGRKMGVGKGEGVKSLGEKWVEFSGSGGEGERKAEDRSQKPEEGEEGTRKTERKPA